MRKIVSKFSVLVLAALLAIGQMACGADKINKTIGTFVDAVKAAREVTTVQNRYGGLSNSDYAKRLELFDKVYATTDRLSDELIKLKEINSTNKIEVLQLIKDVNVAVAALVASGTFNVKNDRSKQDFARYSLLASAGISSIQIAVAAATKPISTENLEIKSIQ